LIGGLLCVVLTPHADAGKWFRRQPQPAVVAAPTAYTTVTSEPAPLGSFYPTPYIMVRGNFPVGGGYTPFDQTGDTTMALYGPTSALRATTAPVLGYSRGYDGRTAIVEGRSFSYPFQPELSPVIYPTQATYFWGFRQSSTPPWWKNGINWVDQN
jgi:hypothetical protein